MSWWRRRRGGSGDDDAPTLRGGSAVSLIVVEGPDRGARLSITAPDVEIGRGEETSARGNRVSLRDRSVSSRQARLYLVGDGWMLEHLATAANPTLVNGEPLRRRAIAPGDRIRMGRVMLELRGLGEVPAAAPQGDTRERTEIVRIDPQEGQTTVIRAATTGTWGHVAVLQGPGKLSGARFPLIGELVRLGRQPDCDVVLLDPSISRLHAELVRDGDRVLLRNRSQTNPTSRNGTPVQGDTELAHGDEIGLADSVRLKIEFAGSGEATTAPTSGALRRVMEARVDLEARLEREFVRDGTFLDVDIADSYGLKSSESRPERVFVSFERFRGYVAACVAEHAGRILNSNGDEVMAFFESADGAVRCARGLLSGLPAWNGRENLLERAFRVRIGIHTGRSAVDLASGVAYSPVLDVAGHLQKSAPIGGVLVSAATHSALAGERAGFEAGAELPRENVKTFVLAPERVT
jgi:pSer/pThr/pTyr-binding forkhead associated (FHA) protein